MSLIETARSNPRAGGGSALRDWVRALETTAPIAAHPHRLLSDVIQEVALTQGDVPALLSAGGSLTYRALADRANRFARWALDQGIAKGETVGLMMPSKPEYMAIWLGLTSVGVVVALINTQLRSSSLKHCVDIVTPKHLIVAAEFADGFRSKMRLASHPKIWVHGNGGEADFERIDRAVEPLSGEPLTASERRPVSIANRALLIYTSGTTGLPKAANVSHRRLLQWSFWFAGLMNTGPDDRMYDCLPMYHSVGGVVATGAVLVRGGSVLIRDKFSAQHFWNDVVDGGCTLFQYIGELCRYLVNAPHHPREREHRLRIACGNGLRADVWEKFQERFAVPRILEFYAATEGNVSLYNVEGKIGAIGRTPSFLASHFPLALVQFDAAAGEPVRDQAGFCIRCETGEVGEAIGRIPKDASRPGGEFEGYTSANESEKKVLRGVFKPGDAWFRTGDLMRMDPSGFFYFVDRIGDTFRWKGENVAASEVATTIAAFPRVKEASVYGVPVAGAEGAAGMAAIVTDTELDLVELHEHLAQLPPYARPLFLRITSEIASTATFKQTKSDLQRVGFDPTATDDAIYFDDPAAKAFVRLNPALYARIQVGKIRL
jgi:fatty-acyl-CoA synthase